MLNQLLLNPSLIQYVLRYDRSKTGNIPKIYVPTNKQIDAAIPAKSSSLNVSEYFQIETL